MKTVVEFADLHPGDKILATGPWPLDPPVEVDSFPQGNRVALVNPNGAEVDFMYRGAGLDYTVERPESQAQILVDPEPDVLAALTLHAPSIGNVPAAGGRTHGDPVVGSVVLYPLRHDWHPAVVTYVGPKRVRLAYVTKSGIRKRDAGYWWPVLRPFAPLDAVYVVGSEPWVTLALHSLKGK